MGRNRGHDHGRGRHKGLETPEEIDHAIAMLRERIPQIEELKKDGLPYLDALRAKAEFQLRDTISDVFGEKSQEYDEYRHHKIKACTPNEIASALALVQFLISLLEDKKLDLADGGHRYEDRAASGPTGRAPVPPPPRVQVAPPSVQQIPPPSPPVRQAAPPPPPPPPRAQAEPMFTPTATPPRTASRPHPRVQEPAPAPAETRPSQPPEAPVSPDDPVGIIRKICRRFHPVARQLRQRQEERSTLEVEDESDVQDVMRALLCLDFDEIATEDWTPSYSEGRPREDLVLERQGIVLQVKRTRHGLGPKEIAAQLAVDIQHYIIHPTCRVLFCFIYDPEARIGNPRGLETKLSGELAGRTVEVLISPK